MTLNGEHKQGNIQKNQKKQI